MSLPNNLELGTAFLLACYLKATLVLAAAWILAGVLRGRSAAFRHSIWAAAILATLALPLLMLSMPAWRSAALGNVAAAAMSARHAPLTYGGSKNVPAMIVNAVLTAPSGVNWAGWILLGWAAGFGVFAVRFGGGLIGLRRRASRCEPLNQREWERSAAEICRHLEIRRTVRLLQGAQTSAMPVTWGVIHPVILIPRSAESWPENRRKSVLSHELAHVARLDWTLQICAELMRAIYWFHPLAWVAAKRLRTEGERACDDWVLNSGVEASYYAKQLLELASTLGNPVRNWSSAIAFARQTNLEGRFSAMLNSSINRESLPLRTKMLMALAAICMLVPLAAVRVPAQNAAGKFSGIISDPSGMPIANATVIMDNHKWDGVHGIQMTTSDAEGKYSFVGLPAGEYEVRVTKPGFAEFRATISSLDSGHDSPRNDITLQIGGVNEEIDVIADGGRTEGIKQGVAGGVSGGASSGAKDGVSGGKTIRVRIGGEVQAPKIIEKVQPVYPEKAKTAGIEGTVFLHAIISKDGNPYSLRVMNNQIDPDLARAAVEAVSKWRYRPTLLNGEPVEVDTTIMVNFTLRP